MQIYKKFFEKRNKNKKKLKKLKDFLKHRFYNIS